MIDLRWRHVALGIAAGAGIGATGAYAYLRRQPHQPLLPQHGLFPADVLSGNKQPGDQASVFRFHPACKFGVPQTDVLRIYDGYVASFDQRSRNPKWVLEYVSRESLRGEGTREQSFFFEDPGVDPRLRNKLDDFRDSGYDRGHLAPAANHRASQKAMDDTFSLSNVSPQVGPGFNRDFWARFEKMVKDAAKHADGVYICSGPLWLPSPAGGSRATPGCAWEMRHPMIGQPPALVAVPTHFFKVVLAENSSRRHGPHEAALGAFVMPNAAIDPDTPVTAFAVPLDALEAAAGAKFFPGFVSEARRKALDAAALAWQADGHSKLKTLDRLSLAQDQALLLSSSGAGSPSSSSRIEQPQQQKRGPGRPSKAAIAEAAAAAQQQHQAKVEALRAKTVDGQGAVHLCDVMACKLPDPGWWENNGQGRDGGGGGGGGGLQRQNSGRGGGGGSGRRQGGPPGARELAAVAEAAAAPVAPAAPSSSSSSSGDDVRSRL